MGDRAGYRFKGLDGRESAYLRKQWAIQEGEGLERPIRRIAENLVDGREIGSGRSALRGDLKKCPGRGLHSLIKAEGSIPFDEVTQDIPGDIRRIIEFDVSDPYEWEIRYIPESEFEEEDAGHVIAKVHFKKGKSISKGFQFDWIGHKQA